MTLAPTSYPPGIASGLLLGPGVVAAPAPGPGGVSGAGIDGGWYLAIVRFAQRTPWLHEPATVYTGYGVLAFAVLLLAVWWRARPGSDARMAAALMAPPAAVVAYGVNEMLKQAVTEIRPCLTLHVTGTVLPCDGPTDWAFPSNHSAVVAAIAAGLFVTDRLLGWIAAAGALLMGLTRLYVGAHYPHDVLAGLVLGALVGALLGLLARTVLAGPVRALRHSALRPLLATGPATSSAPGTTAGPAETGAAKTGDGTAAAAGANSGADRSADPDDGRSGHDRTEETPAADPPPDDRTERAG